MSHVAHMMCEWHTYDDTMAHIRQHLEDAEPRHTVLSYARATPHIRMSHVTHMTAQTEDAEPRHAYEPVTPHIQTSHGTHTTVPSTD